MDPEEIAEAQGNVSWISSFKLYFNQKAWRPAFALAMLYFTVLSFDNVSDKQDFPSFIKLKIELHALFRHLSVANVLISVKEWILAGNFIRRQARSICYSSRHIHDSRLNLRPTRKCVLYLLWEMHGTSAYCADRIFRESLEVSRKFL